MHTAWCLVAVALSFFALADARVGNHRHNGDLSGSKPVGLPSWNVTYNALQSTIFMPCNYSGYFNASFAASFGVLMMWLRLCDMHRCLGLRLVQREAALGEPATHDM